jgi:hypothetical protein
MSYLHYLYLFPHNGVQHTLCCVFVFLRSVYLCFQFLWIILFDCPSLFSNVYLISLHVRSISYDICFPCCKGLLPTDKLLSRARVAQ